MRMAGFWHAVHGIVGSVGLAAAALGVPLFFAFSTAAAGSLGAALRLQVEPSIAGGRAWSRFADPIGDDSGAGELQYPLGQAWERGELDLVGFAVREPVKRPVWSSRGAYWQLEASFAKAALSGLAGGGFRAPVLHVYIGVEGAASGSTESAFGEGELLRFDPGRPWNYAISADGWSCASIVSADGAYRAPVEAAWDLGQRRLTLRVDLARAPPPLASVLGGRPNWHYVLVGACDLAREGHFAALRHLPSLHEGGGATDELCPRVFDLLAPRGSRQESELASESAAAGRLALVYPVMVGQGSTAREETEEGRTRESLKFELARDQAKAEAGRALALAALGPASLADEGRIGELYALGLDARALVAAEGVLGANPSDALALAYRGAIVARSARNTTSLAKKMTLVEKAYSGLDRAVAEAKPLSKESMAAFLCRGSVSLAVPDEVFGRAAQGAADFEAAAALAAAGGDGGGFLGCLAQAALAYEKAGLEVEAAARWATLAARGGLPASILLELLDRGYGDPGPAPSP